MPRSPTIARPSNNAKTKAIEKRNSLWPNASNEVWSSKGNKGYNPMPRIISLAIDTINAIKSGKDCAGGVYLVLWCHDFGEGFVEVRDPIILAAEAGYSQSEDRALRSWNDRLNTLVELGFIRSTPNGSRKHAFILIRDPHLVLAELKEQGKIDDARWTQIVTRALDIGVKIDSYLTKVKAETASPAAS